MNKEILKLPHLMSEFSSREEVLMNRIKKNEKRLTVQNVKIEGLWKDSKIVLLINHLDKEGFVPITQKMFIEEYKKLNETFNELLNHADSNIYNKELNDRTENIIVDQFHLFNVRWDSICIFLQTWYNQRQDYRKTELSLMAEKEFILTINEDQFLCISKIKSIAIEQIELIEKQLEFITAEESLCDEMELIYKERERLFGISSELFFK